MSTSKFLLNCVLYILAFVASPMRGRALGSAILRKTGLWNR
jgi:hypothetical protein